MDPRPARVFLREIDAPATGASKQHVIGCFQFPKTSVGQTRIAFSADGCRLALSAGTHLRVFDLEGEQCPTPRGQPAEPCTGDGLAYPPIPGRLRTLDQLDHLIYALALGGDDGRYLAIGTTNGQLRWTDLDSCNLVPTAGDPQGFETPARYNWLDGSRGTLLDAAFLRANGAGRDTADDAQCNGGAPRLVSVGKDGTVRVWNPEDRVANPIEIAGNGNELHAIAIAEDGGLMAAGDSNGQVLVWDRNVQDYACSLVIRNLTQAEWAEHLYGKERDALETEGLELGRLCPETPAEGLKR